MVVSGIALKGTLVMASQWIPNDMPIFLHAACLSIQPSLNLGCTCITTFLVNALKAYYFFSFLFVMLGRS